ncbi:MAG: acyl-CoA dehydrogenase, partial [Actinobacteria bacterium]
MIESEAEYRQRARRWLAANLTPAGSSSHRLGPADGQTESEWVARSRAIQAKLSEGGYAGITLPPELGGAGLDQRYQQIFDEESAGYELPPYFAGARGPTFYLLLACMSDAHQHEHIPAILDGREVWCQLMSEPGAGSDLAGVVTRADRDGDEWVINGQKVWTTDAHFSEYGICLARTDFDVPKHAGLTMFFVSMDTPGVTARPLRQADGSAAFNEVFLDDVRIPAENVLGEVNQGWSTV